MKGQGMWRKKNKVCWRKKDRVICANPWGGVRPQTPGNRVIDTPSLPRHVPTRADRQRTRREVENRIASTAADNANVYNLRSRRRATGNASAYNLRSRRRGRGRQRGRGWAKTLGNIASSVLPFLGMLL